jgi:hypothetical protein
MVVFSGDNRRNASMVVEGNLSVPVGAPVRIPISSGAMVVL